MDIEYFSQIDCRNRTIIIEMSIQYTVNIIITSANNSYLQLIEFRKRISFSGLLSPISVFVSHILSAIEQSASEFDDWAIWLGNSMTTPEPINSKEGLFKALGLDADALKKKIAIW